MERFVCYEKTDFVGREALLRRKQSGVNTCLVYTEVDAEDADVRGGEPIWAEGEVIGVATSGGYGPGVGKSLAFAYVTPQYAAPDSVFEIEILGEKRAANVLTQPAYDPKNKRLQS
ncbi:MAG TPA: glycine cleavage T C-terminal barrel domain-containing protein, partial [Anaerolineales bacterium]|nr:glycine cleavage T C-terminal barrel domain-containing protein [Anaerolineales bacterium]